MTPDLSAHPPLLPKRAHLLTTVIIYLGLAFFVLSTVTLSIGLHVILLRWTLPQLYLLEAPPFGHSLEAEPLPKVVAL